MLFIAGPSYLEPSITSDSTYNLNSLQADFQWVDTLAVAADHQLLVLIASNPYLVLRRLYHEKEACG